MARTRREQQTRSLSTHVHAYRNDCCACKNDAVLRMMTASFPFGSLWALLLRVSFCGFLPSLGCRRLHIVAHEALHLVVTHLQSLFSLVWPSSLLLLLWHPSLREYFPSWKEPSTFLSTFRNILSREREISYDTPYMWNLDRNDTNELTDFWNHLMAAWWGEQ